MNPRTSNNGSSIDPPIFDKRRLEDDSDSGSDSDSDLTSNKQTLDELYEIQRNEMLNNNSEIDNTFDHSTTEPKFYEYSALKKLIDDELVIESDNAMIHICAFQVNTKGKVPFLQFFMEKHLEQDNISFPSFAHMIHTNPFLKAQNIVDLMSLCYGKQGFMKYSGYFCEKDNYYLFFDANDFDISIHDLYRTNHLWLLTIDELVNTQKVCENFRIDSEVTQFFQNNPEFIYLKDSNMDNYEIPVIAYIGTTSAGANFISVFGECRSECKSIFGPHYYFYDYQYAVKNAMNKYIEKMNEKENAKELFTWIKKIKPLEGSVIRFALFLGRMKIVENSIDDKPDSSQTTRELLKEDITCASMKHRQLVNYLRISDRDGMWKNEYDSIFLGEGITLDDESIHCHGTTYVVKDYEQQLPLSCHFLDPKTMNLTWIKDDKYYII